MKIFERAIHKQLYDHLVTNKLLPQFQSGFRPGHSTSTALLDVSDYILKNIDEGNLTGAVFLDLSKAFDIIDHSLLKIINLLHSVSEDEHWPGLIIIYLAEHSLLV